VSFVNDQLIELFGSNEFDGKRKIVISSAGTSNRNNLKQYLGPKDVLYAGVLPNPSLKQLVDFFRIIQPTKKDVIVGIGGGSVIDFSKLVALFAETPNNQVKSIIESARYHSIQKALTLVVVPTLFGSGAEQTPFAVCYIGKKKYSVANDLILPARVEYIPEINISASSKIKLANVLDCFCQATESLTARNANKISTEFAVKTLRLLVPIAKEYIEESSIDLSAKMAEASSLCGKAIAISKTTGPHAMSYYLTSQLNWEHGKAVAMTFLFFFDYYERINNEDPNLHKALKVLSEVLPHKSTFDFFEYLGLECDTLAVELIDKINISEWVTSVNIERLSNGPRIHMNWLKSTSLAEYYKSVSN